MPRIIVNGGFGRMGFITQQMLSMTEDLELLLALGKEHDFKTIVSELEPDIVIDFTTPEAVFHNAKIMIALNARPVIGTTGLTESQIAQLATLCEEKGLGGIIAPNFSISAILMMRYAQDAAKYFDHTEIVEIHHEKKIDSPSGTALKTAEMIGHARRQSTRNHQPASPDGPGRGVVHHDVPIHSVRLPGHFAHQMVIFSEEHETLTIRCDNISRESMMAGVRLACIKVMQLDHLVYGMENII